MSTQTNVSQVILKIKQDALKQGIAEQLGKWGKGEITGPEFETRRKALENSFNKWYANFLKVRGTARARDSTKPPDKYEQLAIDAAKLAAESQKTAKEASAKVTQTKTAREIREAETAQRKATIKQQEAERAEKVARLEQIRQDSAKRDQDISERTEISEDELRARATVKSSSIVTSVTGAGTRLREDLTRWADLSDKLYEKGNFLTEKEKADWLKDVQDTPFIAYDIMNDSKGMKPPESFDEALARVQYMTSEIALGGARELALPLSWGVGQPRRTEDIVFQVIGGLITPSPTDYLIQQSFRSLASAGKKGTNILRKAMKGTVLTSDEALQFEKWVGQYGYSTSDLRKAGSKLGNLDDLSNAQWADLLEKYQKYYEFWEANPDLYGAGAAYKPSLLQEFGEILDDIGYDSGEYIDFLKINKVDPTIKPTTIIGFLKKIKPTTPDLDAYQDVLSDVENFRESLDEKLDELTEPVLRTTDLILIDPPKPIPPIPIIIPDIISEPEQPISIIPIIIPDIIQDIIPTVIPTQITEQTPEQILETPQEQILDEPLEPTIPNYPELIYLTPSPRLPRKPSKKRSKSKLLEPFVPFGFEEREYDVLTPDEMLSLGNKNKKNPKGLFVKSKSKKKSRGDLWL